MVSEVGGEGTAPRAERRTPPPLSPPEEEIKKMIIMGPNGAHCGTPWDPWGPFFLHNVILGLGAGRIVPFFLHNVSLGP